MAQLTPPPSQIDIPVPAAPSTDSLRERYQTVRAFSHELCETLKKEDYVVQTMADVSPTKWHLAHTSWFFETFILKPAKEGYAPLNSQYEYLFNSYYNTVGSQFCRPKRGTLSRPDVDDVFAYRAYVDKHMNAFFEEESKLDQDLRDVIELGLHHEQQHQELMLTDIKHVFASNPLYPALHEKQELGDIVPPPMEWRAFEEGIHRIGHDGDGFAFDNEGPRHNELVPAFAIGSRLITNGEFMEFIEDGGYTTPNLWLSDAWALLKEVKWDAPLYWAKKDGRWMHYTLHGAEPVDPNEPVTHVSFYEADAFARWSGARLPTEGEWETASEQAAGMGNFVESKRFHPAPLSGCGAGIQQMFGDTWEWTGSPYRPYPGYQPAAGALGEYNGKFMCNQMVLRGGSCGTSATHIRPTYRNFFPPNARWQFTGIRLAQDL